ncbi:MAG: hypothetical protein ACLFUL_03395 [Desulfobacteraceae bacterium]
MVNSDAVWARAWISLAYSSQRGKWGFFDAVVMGRSPIPTHTRNRGIDQVVAPVFTIDARVAGCTGRPHPQDPG